MHAKEHDGLTESIVDKQVNRWSASEYCCYETPLFSILPRFLFKWRNKTLLWLHKTVLRFFGIEFTIGGILFMLTAFIAIGCIEYNYFSNSARVHYAGLTLGYTIALTFTIASKNSIWSLITGASWDRTLILHKSTALLIILAAGFHVGYNWSIILYVKSGLYMVIILSAMIVGANYFVRRYVYNLFYLLHIFGIATFIYFAYQHGARPVFYGVALWLFDVAIRFVVFLANWARLSKAYITLNKHTVKITIKRRWFSYKPGQYAFLWIPAVSFWESHPFTISSSPDKDYITFTIKNAGNWTGKLHELAKDRSSLLIGVQGAYGTTSLDIDSDKYKRFVFIAGGIGVTPMRSIANSICDQITRGRVAKIDFIWSVKDYSMVNDILNVKEDNMLNVNSDRVEIEGSTYYNKLADISIYVTRSDDDANEKAIPILNNDQALLVYTKRCDLSDKLKVIKKDSIDKNIKRVAVLVCGPPSMVDQASKVTRKLSDSNISFDFHCETFEL